MKRVHYNTSNIVTAITNNIQNPGMVSPFTDPYTDVADSVTVGLGDTINLGITPPTFTAPPAPTAAQVLATAQANQILLINKACQEALAAVITSYPELEVLSWDQQLSEAEAYTANSSASTPLLSAISTASGKTVAALSASIITENTTYKASVGAIIGKRQNLTAQINAATSVPAVQAIVW